MIFLLLENGAGLAGLQNLKEHTIVRFAEDVCSRWIIIVHGLEIDALATERTRPFYTFCSA
jgi:hypothetical protein